MSKSKEASTERLKNLQFSFEGDTVKAIQGELTNWGPANCKVNVALGMKEDGTLDMWVQVENKHTRSCGEWHNVVHTCPPDCGNGG